MPFFSTIAEISYPIPGESRSKELQRRAAKKVHLEENGRGLARFYFEDQNGRRANGMQQVDNVAYDLDRYKVQFAGIYVDPSKRGRGVADVIMEASHRILEEAGLPIASRTSVIRKPQIAGFLGRWSFTPTWGGTEVQIQGYDEEGVPLLRSSKPLPTPRWDHWYRTEEGPFLENEELKIVTIGVPFRVKAEDTADFQRRRAALSESLNVSFRNLNDVRTVIQRLRDRRAHLMKSL